MATGQVGAKKSLFKKPAWASTTAGNAVEDAPIFGQAHLYQEIVQAQKERREKHAIKQKERAEKEGKRVEERELKRRRISKEAEDNDEESNSDARSTRSASVDSQNSHKSDVYLPEEKAEEPTDTPRKTRTRLADRLDTSQAPRTRSQKSQPSTQGAPILLDDDEDDHEDLLPLEPRDSRPSRAPQPKPPDRRKPKQPVSEPESSEEDEYLRELKAKARREARSKNLDNGTGKEITPEPSTTQISANDPSASTDLLASPSRPNTSYRDRATSTPAAEDEAVVKIWIKTIIPNAKEVIVNRKIGQPLDKVKDFWMKRNELDPGLASKVFFTWNGTRLYNSTTMRGIVERLKKAHPTPNGDDPSHGHVVIEAVTDEIFEHRQKQRAAAAARLAAGEGTDADMAMDPSFPDHPDGVTGANVDITQADRTTTTNGDDNDQVHTPQPPAAAAASSGIVLKLKAQGLEEMSLRVRPHTTVRKIVAGFRAVRLPPASAAAATVKDKIVRCWLSYDGDRLDDDEATVEEIGFENGDVVEVYLR